MFIRYLKGTREYRQGILCISRLFVDTRRNGKKIALNNDLTQRRGMQPVGSWNAHAWDAYRSFSVTPKAPVSQLPRDSINTRRGSHRVFCSYSRMDRISRRHGRRMRKALVAPSVGMATAPSVPASGRSILDDDRGGSSGGDGGSGGGGGGGGVGDDDDDDAQIRKDECAMGARRGVEIRHRVFQIAIRTRSFPSSDLPPGYPAGARNTYRAPRGLATMATTRCKTMCENDSPWAEVSIFIPLRSGWSNISDKVIE